MKKKILAMCLIVCLLATAVVGGTLAYFTDTDDATNVMALGNVSIEQNEEQLTNEGALEPFEQDKKLFPMVDNRANGDSVIVDGYFNGKMANVIDKIVTVTNDGSEDAYVRTILAFETAKEYKAGTDEVLRNGKEIFDTYIGTLGDFELLERGTIVIDGVEYVLAVCVYEKALPAGETSAPSLKQFFLSPNANNETTVLFGDEYTILALSQATQTAGFEDVDGDGSAAAEALDRSFGNLETIDESVIIGWFTNP